MRAFVAIEVPEPIRRELARHQAAFRHALGDQGDQVSWVRPEGIHLTLKFLGEVPEEGVGRVIAALKSIGKFAPFSVEIRGFGFFPTASRPRVLWAGVVVPPILGSLASQVDAALAGAGFERDDRAFTPHLTLCRFRAAKSLPILVGPATDEGAIGQFIVSELCLFESQLSRGQPASYRKVACFP